MLHRLSALRALTSPLCPPQARGAKNSAAVLTLLAAGLAAALHAAPARADLPPVPVPPENPITEAKRVLGKVLFWDEQLSTSNTVACATCHIPANAGTDPRLARNPGDDGILNTPDDVLGSAGILRSDLSNDYIRDAIFGTQPQITGRSAPAVIMSQFVPDLFWDGRGTSQFTDPQTGTVAIASGGALESQSVGPPQSSVEMAHDGINWAAVVGKLENVRPLDLATNIPPDVAGALSGNPTYAQLFAQAFGDGAITARRIAFAIATYERTLVPDQTPWDAFVAGNPNAMTPQQQQGFNLFQGNARCNLCHTPPLFTNTTFRNIGLRPVTEDNGRQGVTGNNADRGKFKVPTLRNVGLKTTFMHNGQFQTLPQVLAFYAQGPGSPPQFPENRDPIMTTIGLPPQNAGLIQNFIQNALVDPRVRDQTFPFDRPTLFADRVNDRSTILGGGTAGSGGVIPRIFVPDPAMLGNANFRVGLENAATNTNANLGVSTNPPVGGVITPQFFAGSVTTDAIAPTLGMGTLHWALRAGQLTPGQPVYMQWFVQDAGAAGGIARSSVARVPIFCGRAGCPSPCDSIDYNRDGLFPDSADIDDFISVFSGGPCSTGLCGGLDFNNDGLFPDTSDIDALLSIFSGGPCTL